jgi:ppGpp synthetase/RelA/SpoT-type nucleotidyltranferase
MQGIAGLRVVRDLRLGEQTELAASVASIFAGAKVIDRRERPTYGYRAVHVVAPVEGLPVEIQVRTVLQDAWAQAMERLADSVGREVRYGAVPSKHGEIVTRFRAASESIYKVEQALDVVRIVEEQIRAQAEGVPESRLPRELKEEAKRLQVECRRLRKEALRRAELLRAQLGDMLGGA